MKYTNKYNLPQAIVDAVTNDPYDKGASDFSITELIKPARQRALEKKHKDEIVEDVADRLWSLYGQIGHSILERANRRNIVEERYSMVINGRSVSGQIDSLSIEDETIQDYKFTSVWGFTGNKPAKPEHIQQLNCQKLLVENKFKIKISKLEIVALLRDWQLSKSKLDKKYPPPVVVQDIPVWTREETVRFIQDRIYEHEEAAKELPECSSEDTWRGRKCVDYCSVNSFCTQYQTTKKQQGEVWL